MFFKSTRLLQRYIKTSYFRERLLKLYKKDAVRIVAKPHSGNQENIAKQEEQGAPRNSERHATRHPSNTNPTSFLVETAIPRPVC